VHVVGDACIADAMPKSASAAHSQALQCAIAIAALLDGRDPAEPTFDSVCYSHVSADRALAIRGKFNVLGNAIRPIPNDAAQAATPPSSALETAQHAEQWYRRILIDAFAA
jgi:sulfide dehydrogenase [flavocytochrome c] flavoprotein chain